MPTHAKETCYTAHLVFRFLNILCVPINAVYLAVRMSLSGQREVLGQLIAQTEGAKFWLQMVRTAACRTSSLPAQMV